MCILFFTPHLYAQVVVCLNSKTKGTDLNYYGFGKMRTPSVADKLPRADLIAFARKSGAFVERWHAPLSITAIMKTDYERALRQREKGKQ